jgi:hypothetical protein
MSQSLWDILEERIGDLNRELLAEIIRACVNPEDRIDMLLCFADRGFGGLYREECLKSAPAKVTKVMPSCRKNLAQGVRKNNQHGRTSNSLLNEAQSILCKYHFA